jgi:3-deoxy-D-manno-octulosonic acid kinase
MVPPGFERLLLGHAIAVARSDVAPGIRRSLVSADGTRSTLHEYAARHPAARRMQGRGTAYAVPLPPGVPPQRIVVRHNHHGGLFGRLRGDLFFAPTRAPYELQTSLQLAQLGVPTPQVLAYALYPPGGVLQRADVCSGEIANSRDLADVLTKEGDAERATAFTATARLLAALARAGARHHDLNAKNILLANESAYVLDVDRVTIGGKSDAVFDRNFARLARSLRKWRDHSDARITERDVAELEAHARQAMAEQAPRTVVP